MAFSSQHHSFDIALASKYGVECAILIHHFQHWIRINRYANRNIRDGRCWTYQTRKEIQAHFPYWNLDEIRRLCEKLVEIGVMITSNFNKSSIDKTLWYAFVDEEAFGVGENSNNVYERQNCHTSGKIATSKGKIATSIPDTKPDTKAEDIKEREREKGGKPPEPPARPEIFSYKRVKMDKEKCASLIKDFGESKIKEMMDRLDEYADINPKRFKQYACHATVIRKWIRDDQDKKAEKMSNSKHHGFQKDMRPMDPKRIIKL